MTPRPKAGKSVTTADQRLRRLLAMIPWVASHDGPAVEEVTRRFSISEQELAEELELLYLCGLWPFSPDMLIEADIADGRVWIRYAEYFSRPLRLTPAEGLALLAAGSALLATPGVDPEGPLARGLGKLSAALGVEGDEVVDVDLAPAAAGVLDTVRTAAAESRRVELDYYAFGRDARTRRVVEPWSVFSVAGQWYVRGHCHEAGGGRLFRLDRIRDAVLLDDHFEAAPHDEPRSVFHPRPDDPLVVLDLSPEASWVAEHYPNEGVEPRAQDGQRVRLRVTEEAWLERLLVRLGPRAEVVEGPDVRAAAAARILRRYRAQGPLSSAAS